MKVKIAGLCREDVIHLSLPDLSRKLREVGLPSSLTDVLQGNDSFQEISFKLLLAYSSYYNNLPWFAFSHHFRKGIQRLDLTDVLSRRHQIRTRRIKCWTSNTSKEHPPRDCMFVKWCVHVPCQFCTFLHFCFTSILWKSGTLSLTLYQFMVPCIALHLFYICKA